jgi:hypothetical protein
MEVVEAEGLANINHFKTEAPITPVAVNLIAFP